MALSNDLISQFVEISKGDDTKKTETTVYGTVKISDGKTYVQIDGSTTYTPISTTATAKDGDRVMVMIKDHSAVITGNMTDPSASKANVDKVEKDLGTQISEFDIIISYKVTTDDLNAINANIDNLRAISAKYEDMSAVTAEIDKLKADFADLEYVKAEDVEALNAEITNLEAVFGNFTSISTEDLEAANAEITHLKGHTADFTYVSTQMLRAYKAAIEELDTKKLSAEEATIKYANIDFSNIGKAAMEYLYTQSGLIENVVVGDGTITGNLVGVTIKGDLIEGNTIVADKLVLLGEDGIYYKLNYNGETLETEQTEYNSLDGSIITAKSINATKISAEDLVAFGATIGGFKITAESIYSGVKESANNTTQGIYLDSFGQIAFGDETNFVKFYRETIIDEEGVEQDVYRLAISASTVSFGNDKNLEAALEEVDNKIADSEERLSQDMESQKEEYNDFMTAFKRHIGFWEDENGDPSNAAITIATGDSSIVLRLDNKTGITFEKDGVATSTWTWDDFWTGNIRVDVNERAQFGNFAFVPRNDGSLSFLKVGG